VYAEKLPPHDIEAEEAVIGSLLIDGQAIHKVSTFLKPEDFYTEKNRWCYEACISLFQEQEGINQVTVAHKLSNQSHLEGLGGMAYLSHLVASVPTPVHIENYGRIVSRTSGMRQLIRAAGEIAAIGYEGIHDVDTAIGQAEDALFSIRTSSQVRGFVTLRNVLDKWMEEKAAAQDPLEQTVAPIPTGFVDIDQLLGGLQRSDMIVLAARPSLGKSALALNIACSAAIRGSVAAVFSLEMSSEQVGLRLLSSESGVDSHRLRLGLYTEAEEKRIYDAIGTLSDIPIYIDDSPLEGIAEIRSKARRLHMERRVDLVVVDYLQLIRGSGRPENRVQEISEISRSLKALARDLDAPVLAVSQLSRASEMRLSHRPQLSDLRDSGSIEQDADVVMFIYRDDVYYRNEEEWQRHFPDKPYPKSIADIIVAKHRHGPVDTVSLYFRENLVRFENLSTGTT
jgi:replicative DNA helicase